MNTKNIIAFIGLYDETYCKRRNPVGYFLTKTGTLYEPSPNGQLKLKSDEVTKKKIGATGKELLKAYNKDIFRYATGKGIIIINEAVISDMLEEYNIKEL